MLQAFLCSVVYRERQGLIPYDNNDIVNLTNISRELVSKVYAGFVPFFEQKTSRTFQGLSRTHFAFFKDSIQCKKEIWVYVFFSSTTTWAILSWRSFILGTWESGLDKVTTEIQGLSSTDCNFQGLSRPWTFYFKFQGLSRCVRTLYMGQCRQHKFLKKRKIPISNLSSIYSAELYLGQKKNGMATAIFLNIFLWDCS